MIKISLVFFFLFSILNSRFSFSCTYDYAALDEGCALLGPNHVATIKDTSICTGWTEPVAGCVDTSIPEGQAGYCPGNVCCFSGGGGGISWLRICPNGEPKPVKKDVYPRINACSEGSLVRIDSRSVSEEIYLTGVPFPIVYISDRVKGRNTWYSFIIPRSYSPGANFVREDLEITIAGKVFSYSFGGSIIDFFWDGKDVSNNDYIGTASAQVKVTPWYLQAGTVPVAVKGIPTTENVPVGFLYQEDGVGFGGWNFSIHHHYDPIRRTLYLGDGSTLETSYLERVNGDKWIPSDDKSEVYVFNSNWIHVETKNGLLGSLKYTFTYDTQGRLASVLDAYNNETSIQYTGTQVSSITSPLGHVTEIQTDSNGYISKVINPSNEEYSMTYSSLGLLLSFTKPNLTVSTMTYDSAGRLISDSSNAGSSIIVAESTSQDNTLVEQSKLYREKHHKFTVNNVIISDTQQSHFRRETTNPDLSISAFEQYIDFSESEWRFGAMRSLSKKNDPRFGNKYKINNYLMIQNGGTYYSESYNEIPVFSDPTDPFSLTSLIKKTTIGNGEYQSVFTPSTKTWVTTSPESRTTTDVINNHEAVISHQVGSLTPYNFTYDSKGRLKTVVQGTRTSTLNYNATTGFLESIVNPLNETTSFGYDVSGRLISQTLPDSSMIGFEFDYAGNLKKITPPGKGTHEFSYNGFDLASSYLPPTIQNVSGTSSSYYYNDDKQLIQITKPGGQAVQFNYGTATGLLNSISFLPYGSRTYNYYNGLMSYSLSEDSFQRNMYHNGSMIYYETESGGSLNYNLQYIYNYFLLPSYEYLNSSAIYFSYDNDALLIQAGSQTYQRSPSHGLITSMTLGNASVGYAYSSFGELSGIDAKYTTNDLYSEIVTRDALGRIITKTEKYGTGIPKEYEYSYDVNGRLTQVTVDSSVRSQYHYDSNNNRKRQTVLGQSIYEVGHPSSGSNPLGFIEYDEQDRLIIFGTKSYSYNAGGDLESVTDSATSETKNFTYDVFGNLKTVVLPSKTINYGVDAHNRRMVKKDGNTAVEYYMWNQFDQLIGVTNSSGALVSRFVYGSKSHVPDYMIKGTDKFEIITNHLGSPVVIVNADTGVIVQEITYDEFGNILSDSSPGFTPFGFAGCLYDVETKLCRFGARDYDASIGRWLSKDPILFAGGDTNLYGYVMQDPINLIDPDGKSPLAVLLGPVVAFEAGYAAGTIGYEMLANRKDFNTAFNLYWDRSPMNNLFDWGTGTLLGHKGSMFQFFGNPDTYNTINQMQNRQKNLDRQMKNNSCE